MIRRNPGITTRMGVVLAAGALFAAAAASLTPAAARGDAGSDTLATVLENARERWGSTDETFDENFDYQQSFRSKYDFLDANERAIGNAMVRREENPSFEELGLHLTNTEWSEFESRQDVAARGGDVRRKALEIAGDSYAGQWIDNQDGGVLVVATIGPAGGALETTLQALMPTASDLRVVAARYSLDQLTTWKARIRDMAEAAGQNYIISLDEPTNQLEVGVEDLTKLDLKDIPADAYRVLPYVGVEDASSDLDTDHGANAHPGLRIGVYDYAGNNGKGCTWSFNAHDTAGTNFLLTAAHCTKRFASTADMTSYTTDIWQPNKSGTRLGNNARGFNRRNSYVDAARVKDMNSYTDDNCFHTNTNECYQITSRQLLSQDQIGDTVCGALAVSNVYRCAELLSRDVDVAGMLNLRRWDYYPKLGDSGAGMKYGHEARGMLVKRDNGDETGLYTHIYYNVYYLGVTLNGT